MCSERRCFASRNDGLGRSARRRDCRVSCVRRLTMRHSCNMKRFQRGAAVVALAVCLVPTAASAAQSSRTAKAPRAPYAGHWVLTKKGSNAKGSFTVAPGHGHVLKLTAHGGDPECGSRMKVTLVSKPRLHLLKGAAGVAGQAEWVVGKPVNGSPTGINPAQVKVEVRGHHYPGSLVMQFPTRRTGSGYIVFDPNSGALCTMSFNDKKS